MLRAYPKHPQLTNLAADIAERAGAAFRAGRESARHAAEAYLSAGALLLELKGECSHGQWKDALERAGVPYRSAARLMQIARSGMDAATLAELGLKAAAASLARAGGEAAPVRPESATVAPLRAAPRAALYHRRRDAGQCIVCGAATGGPVRCPGHALREADRRKARRALARIGKTLAPRLADAARARKPLHLDAATVRALAEGVRTDR